MRRLIVLLVAALLASGLTVSPAVAAAPTPPYIRGGQTVPTYSYTHAIHESVFVEAPIDSDHDGKPDRIAVDIDRPNTAHGVRVPVIMDASPYYKCCGRGNENQTKTYYSSGVIAGMPLYYDNYFVPRGYAVVQVDLTGTSRSTGCGDEGGPDEVVGAKAAIDWLNGRAKAYGLNGKPVTAYWTSGKVGMIGKSWDGSIANGVAATGVRGLQTIVPISAISSWYDYTRFNGVLRSPGYVDFLDSYVGGRPPGTCDAAYAAQQKASDDATGDYNAFWAQRNYRTSVGKVHASVFVVHGINDQNVTTNQFGEWWSLLAANHVPRKIWLHQASHVDPFDIRRGVWVDMLHRWFDYWLQGIDNGIMNEPQASVEAADGHWVDSPSWPEPGTLTVGLPLSLYGGGAAQTFTDNPELTEAQAVADPGTTKPGRAVFLSGPLKHSMRITGSPSVTLRVKIDRPTTELSVRLVDYGTQRRVDYLSPGEGISTLTTKSCWGESSPVDSACYLDTSQDFITSDTDIITRGWLDAAHHITLSRRTPLVPGQWNSVTVPIDTTDAVIAAGHRFGLVVTQSDNEYTTPTATGATVTIDPTGSVLDAPLAGFGTDTPPAATRAQFPRTSGPVGSGPGRASRRTP